MTARSRRHRSGLSLVEVLVVLGIVAFLAGLLPACYLRANRASARDAGCRNKLREFHHGLRLYLNNFDAIFPLAWAKPAATASAPDLSGITYGRFLIQSYRDSDFSPTVTDAEKAQHSTYPAAAKHKFAESARFWTDPAKGYTAEYFSSDIILKQPSDLTQDGYDKHTVPGELIQDVPSTDRPLLAGANASVKIDQPLDNPRVNGGETQDGISDTDASGAAVARWEAFGLANNYRVFYGVAHSLRTWSPTPDYETPRFDFRHDGAVNIIFLDGHVVTVKETNKELLRRLHDRWNHLKLPERR